MKKFEIGEKVVFDGFKCIIVDLFIDYETGIACAEVKAIEFECFTRTARLTSLRKI